MFISSRGFTTSRILFAMPVYSPLINKNRISWMVAAFCMGEVSNKFISYPLHYWLCCIPGSDLAKYQCLPEGHVWPWAYSLCSFQSQLKNKCVQRKHMVVHGHHHSALKPRQFCSDFTRSRAKARRTNRKGSCDLSKFQSIAFLQLLMWAPSL